MILKLWNGNNAKQQHVYWKRVLESVLFFFCFTPVQHILRIWPLFMTFFTSLIYIVCCFSQELEEIRKSGMKNFRNIQVEESNLLSWQGLIVPVSVPCLTAVIFFASQFPWQTSFDHFQDNPPYDKGAFRIEIIFPTEYPFKPPKITFKTKIYHPNIDEKGQVCLPVISAENWKPATKTDQGGCVSDTCLCR